VEKNRVLSLAILFVMLAFFQSTFAEEGYFQYKDYQICYEYFPARTEFQDNTPLVLVHGFMGSRTNFYPLITKLRGKIPIFTLDLLGFGDSSKPKVFTYSRSNLAESLASFIENSILEPVDLLGHSMGGEISLFLARNNPHLIKKLILVDSAAYSSTNHIPGWVLSLKPVSAPVIDIFLLNRPMMKYFLKRGFLSGKIPKVRLNSYVDSALKSKARVILDLARDNEGGIKKEEIQKITTPTLIIWGEDDEAVPLEIGRKLDQDLPDSRLVIIPGTAHLPFEEKPEVVSREVLKFTVHENSK